MREAEIVYHGGTYSDTEPSCGINDFTLKETVKTALGTASLADELVKLISFSKMTCC